MKTTKPVSMILLLLFLMLSTSASYAASQTPEQLVRSFYTWYFATDQGSAFPLDDDKIFDYVLQSSVQHIRSENGLVYSYCDYFTRVANYDKNDWTANMIIHPAISLALDTTVVPVTFGSTRKINVVVFLKKENNRYYISKVEDTWAYGS